MTVKPMTAMPDTATPPTAASRVFARQPFPTPTVALPARPTAAGAARLGVATRAPVMSADEDGSPDGAESVITKTKPKTQKPPLYKVLMLNDDYTPMEFVVHVLERFFGMSHAQAFELMLVVHKKGVAVVGVFSHEVAETKVAQVMDFARRHQHPLQCTMEKE